MKKITIELLEERNEELGLWSGWLVRHGDKYADGLGYDEMLGLVAAITMPEKRPAIHWLKTKEEHKAWSERLTSIDQENGKATK